MTHRALLDRECELIPGHEVVGTIAAFGKNVLDFTVGARCVADPSVVVSTCRLLSGRRWFEFTAAV
jgi:D-arabinose 1-dehydrogenase-like Zn-dependent alcohol dehydrogenase